MFSFINDNLLTIIFQFFIGFSVTWIVSSYGDKIKFIVKNRFEGPQKIHDHFTPRYGGISLFLSVLFFVVFCNSNFKQTLIFILLASLPAFISGFLEDLTNKIKPEIRLLGSIISGFVMVLILDIKVTRLGINFIDYALGLELLSLFVTVFACVILIQAYNIIDGLNGLASINFISMLTSVFFISIHINDYFLIQLSVILFFSVSGFFLFNFPFGRVFLGDGGAYLIGFLSAFTVIFLSQTNDVVQPATSLLLIIFPVYELLRSTLRRSFQNLNSIFQPDDKHLHSLIYKQNKKKHKKSIVYINSFSTLQISIIPIFSAAWAYLFYYDIFYLYLGIFLSIVLFEIMIFNFSYLKKTNKNIR